MAVEMNIVNDNNYIGTLKAKADTKNGLFVTPDYSNGEGVIPSADADGEVLLVNNVNTNIDEQAVADADFDVKTGEYLRLKQPQVGETYTLDSFDGTPSVGDSLAVGADGVLGAVGARTPQVTFKVVDASATLFGNDAIKVKVTQV